MLNANGNISMYRDLQLYKYIIFLCRGVLIIGKGSFEKEDFNGKGFRKQRNWRC